MVACECKIWVLCEHIDQSRLGYIEYKTKLAA